MLTRARSGREGLMVLADVIREAEALDATEPAQRLFHAAEIGEHLDGALADPQALTAIARRIAALARELGCDRVLGASRLGERLASAAVISADNGLGLFQPDQHAEHVLVIDGVAATGAQISAAYRLAESKGAGRVSAAAVVILPSSRAHLAQTIGVVTPLGAQS